MNNRSIIDRSHQYDHGNHEINMPLPFDGAQMRAAINMRLTESGEKERLKEVLRGRLMESGWREQLRTHCRQVVNERGLDNVTVEELITEVTPKARSMVHANAKKEILNSIRTFIATQDI